MYYLHFYGPTAAPKTGEVGPYRHPVDGVDGVEGGVRESDRHRKEERRRSDTWDGFSPL